MRTWKTLAALVGTSLLSSLVACTSPANSSDFGGDKTEPGTFQNGDPNNGGALGSSNGADNGGSAAAPAGDLAACATSTAAATAKPVYLVFMFDRSGSMLNDSKWTATRSAAQAFFESSDSAGVSASLTFFPENDNSCSTALYAEPDVELTKLPSTDFEDAFGYSTPDGQSNTPTLPALQGAIQYAQAAALNEAKDGSVAIVLVTDGLPNICNSSVSAVVSEAGSVAKTLPTYVIGVGPEGASNLQEIAVAGGTKSAFSVDVTNPTAIQGTFEKAVNQIKQSALSCEYKIPAAPSGETFDRSKVNVQYTPAGAAAKSLGYNQGCAGGTGWQYDNANAPTEILVCDSTCNDIKSASGKVDIVFGCETKTGAVN